MSTQTKKETRESWKTPTVMGSLAAVVLVFFGILGKPESVAFELTGVMEAVQLPNIDVPSNVLGIASGILLLAIAGFVAWRVFKNIRSSIWLSIVFGAIALVSLLGWLAGGQVVPVALDRKSVV